MVTNSLSDAAALRRRYALSLIQQGTDSSPTLSPLGAVARSLQGGLGGLMAGQLKDEEQAEDDKAAALLMNAPGLGGGSPSMSPGGPQPNMTELPPTGGSPASIRTNNPGAQWPGPMSAKYGATGFQNIGGGNKIAVFNTPEEGGAAQFDLLKSRYAGMPLLNAVAKWSGNEKNPQAAMAYAQTVSKATGLPLNAPITPEMLSGPQGIPLAKSMAKYEAGRDFPMTDEQWAAAQGKVFPGESGAMPPGAQLAQGNMPPGRAPSRSDATGGIPPDQAAYIRALLANPKTRAEGTRLYNEWAKPKEGNYVPFGDKGVLDKTRGTVTPLDEQYRPASPQERAAAGLGDYKGPLFFGPGNKPIFGPPSTSVNIDQKGETAFAQSAGKNVAERFDNYVKAGDDAKGMIANLGNLAELGSRIGTGKGAQVRGALGPYAEALGIKIDGLDDIQAFEAIVNKMAPQMRAVGSGATSDFEMRGFLKSLPALGNTPQGNALIGQTLEAMGQYAEARSEIASRAMAGEIKPSDAAKMIRELPDPLTLYRESTGKAPTDAGAPATAPAKVPAGVIQWGRDKSGNPVRIQQ